MSDSSESAFGFLSNWKLGLAVCVPCFAVGLGVTYYYYARNPGDKQTRSLPVQGKNNKKCAHVNSVDDETVQKSPDTNGINQNAVKKVPV